VLGVTTTKTPSRQEQRRAMLTDFTLSPVSPEDRRRAALAVAARGGDRDDVRLMLEALGLLDDPAVRRSA